ncbi:MULTISPECIES: RNA polymerase sigma factor [Variovorax]|uniref:RNA polymerase sigma factor n=1 Tax=Variovorax TaxID=34072 RepID=UPI001ACB24E4|nr:MULTISPECIES: RNA polymerase sigma factor [Variovorax]MBN8752877.1 RNA polymerase sigma factor [Variovorax sp.]UKI08014.1 RNA polymerase sigma factor [Variovorax paradoxus]
MEPIEAAMADRSRAALSAFVTSHYVQLVRRLTRHLGCPDLASDALHDAWLRLADIDSFHLVGNPDAYVYRAACNAALDRLRSARLRQHAHEADAELARVADHAPGPHHIAEARSDVMAVDRAMRHLPHRHRSILVGLRVHEMSRQEVAIRQGLSLRRVDTVLDQALAYCAGHLRGRPHAGPSAPI